MKVLIVEDETVAAENLVAILHDIDSSIQVLGNTESVQQTVKWLQQKEIPDLIFMDIQLSDGLSFAVFEQIDVEIPIIFTTAYDQYAIDAFKVNSIDYLLKPIRQADVEAALNKHRKLNMGGNVDYRNLLNLMLSGKSNYKSRFLVPYKDKLLPVEVVDISCFYTTNKNTMVLLRNGSSYTITGTLDQIMNSLNPEEFIRANKQFIVSRASVKNITIWFDNRLLVVTDVETPERIYVSKNKAAEFKAWLVK